MTILINHMGYRVGHSKTFIVQDSDIKNWESFIIVDQTTNKIIFQDKLIKYGQVAKWHTGSYWSGNFTGVDKSSKYKIIIMNSLNERQESELFEIDKGQINLRLISALTYYFKGQRDSGEWASVDKNASFSGERSGNHNVYGGWFDATGDLGIHMSHQTFTSYFNPQQLPFSVYSFFKSYEQLEGKSPNYTMVKRHILDEGTFGADTLVRRYVPERSFIKSVNRQSAYSLVDSTRKIGFELHNSSWQFGEASTFRTEDITDLNYETSFRSGGGIAIAALAIAARHPYPGSQYSTDDYLQVAKLVYSYLKKENNTINNDGRTNLLDEYCALYASIELYKTTGEYGYLLEANKWGDCVAKRIKSFGDYKYFTVDKNIPFFHPSDEGMPFISLCMLYKVTDDDKLKSKIRSGLLSAYDGLMYITKNKSNPFLYPKLTVGHEGKYREQFFFPHQSAASPWWQGENARIASLAIAVKDIEHLELDFRRSNNEEFIQNQIDWILGKNPYNSTMMEGYGKNAIQYYFGNRLDFINAPGGIVNGITSGLNNEEDIEFVEKPNKEVKDNWRWAEQWIPHASWFLLLLCTTED